MNSETLQTHLVRSGVAGRLNDYLELTKPRVMSLLLLTTFGAMVLARGGVPETRLLASVLIGGALAAGGASAINHAVEGDLDVAMRRTKRRPVARGSIGPRHALAFGLALTALAFATIGLGANLLAAALALAGGLIYVFVYTLWLKRASTQNIVVGGAAGAIPPLVGWAAVAGHLSLPAWYLFAIVFFWTPPHFWALAILIRDDYRAAGVPMLPVVAGIAQTRRAIFLYTLMLLAPSALLFVVAESLGLAYLAGALAVGGLYILLAARLFWNHSRSATSHLYRYSLLYLAVLFVFIIVDGGMS